MMHSKRKWIGILLILALSLISFSAVVQADPAQTDNDQDGLTVTQENALGTSDSLVDSDNDGLCDGPVSATGCQNLITASGARGGEDVNANGVVDVNETDPANPDTDGDGIEDGWEWVFGSGTATVPQWIDDLYNATLSSQLNPTASCGATDPLDATDRDKDLDTGGQDDLSNYEEFTGVDGFAPTNPCEVDTDADGFWDGDEVHISKWNSVTDPNNPDTDSDGLCDGVEHNTGAFAPNVAYPIEANVIDGNSTWNLYPTGACASQLAWAAGDVGSDPTKKDTDGDGIWDGVEATGSSNDWEGDPPVAATGGKGSIHDPNSVDTDGDTLSDDYEIDVLGTDPTHEDTDGDGMPDWFENNYSCLDPTVNDRLGDPDNDGLYNVREYWGNDVNDDGVADVDLDGSGGILRLDPCNPDTDGDGMQDGWEYIYSAIGDAAVAAGQNQGLAMCADLNGDGNVNDGVMNPFSDDSGVDFDGDGVWNMLENEGLDGVAAVNDGSHPPAFSTSDDTSPCNFDTDGEGFDDGYEYWVSLYLRDANDPGNDQNLCDAGEMDPSTPSATTGNPDGDMDYQLGGDLNGDDALNNREEYRGVDGALPARPYTQLIDPNSSIFMPGDDATSACVADTDQGGVDDGHERALGLDPTDPADDYTDRDGDGMPDVVEDDTVRWGYLHATAETDWNNPDTDADRLCDGGVGPNGEYPGADLDITTKADNYMAVNGAIYGWNAADGDFTTWICVAGEDRDNSGTIEPAGADGDPNTLDDNETNPRDWNTDDDSASDFWEVMARGEAMPPAPWVSTPDANGEYQCQDPNTYDNANDPDGDGIANTYEFRGPNTTNDTYVAAGNSFDGNWPGADNIGDDEYTNPCKIDTDGGGAQDNWEWVDTNNDNIPDLVWKDPLDPTDDMEDLDWDGLADVFEDKNHNASPSDDDTSFQNPDTDGDALCDGVVAPDGWYDAYWNLPTGDAITGGNAYAGVGTHGNVKVLIINGDMFLDADGVYDPSPGHDDRFICRGGEDTDLNGDIAGDGNGDRVWNVDAATDPHNPQLEQWQETDPGNPDTDGDALCDGAGDNELVTNNPCDGDNEVAAATDPLDADSDDDQMDDALEFLGYQNLSGVTCLDPNNPDTDADGLWDGFGGGQPVAQQYGGSTDPGRQGYATWYGYDGMDDMIATADDQPGENPNLDAAVDLNETDACQADTDADGVSDGIEYNSYEVPTYARVSPNWDSSARLRDDTDIDGDAARPARDVDSDGDLLCDGPATAAGCTGGNTDANGDGYWDGMNLSSLIGEDVHLHGTVDADETDPMNPDSDGDNVSDGIEVRWYETFDCATWQYTDPLNVTHWDCDGDGVRNARDADSDNDGLWDGWDANGDGEDLDHNGKIAGDANENRIWDANETFTETDPLNPDTDGDGVSDKAEKDASACFNPLNFDSDDDGLWDGPNGPFGGEDRNGNGVIDGDANGDGVVDPGEIWTDTSPCNPDTDEDGVIDFVEVWGWEQGYLITDGWDTLAAPQPTPDPDGDGRVNAVDVDSDNDGLIDGEEDPQGDGIIDWGGFSTNFQPFRKWAPATDDPNWWVNDLGWSTYFDKLTSPTPDQFGYPVIGGSILPDQPVATGDWDRDRVIDASYVVPDPLGQPVEMWEDWGETDPLNADTDGDGINDQVENQARYAGIVQQQQPGFCNGSSIWGPVSADQDGDGLVDGMEDMDRDGVYYEPHTVKDNDKPTMGGTGTSPIPGPGAQNGVETDPCAIDSDGDGLNDGNEALTWNTSPADTDTDDDGIDDFGEATGTGNAYDGLPTDPTNPDSDGDTLSDGDEVTGALNTAFNNEPTNPNAADTDGDGLSDAWEINNGTNPNDPNDPPTQGCSLYDFNNDGIIDILDINLVIVNSIFNNAPYEPRYDVNGDNVVDIVDISMVAAHYGETCP